jgi:hypothetical protein
MRRYVDVNNYTQASHRVLLAEWLPHATTKPTQTMSAAVAIPCVRRTDGPLLA